MNRLRRQYGEAAGCPVLYRRPDHPVPNVFTNTATLSPGFAADIRQRGRSGHAVQNLPTGNRRDPQYRSRP
jgi:hypothetical protein